MLCLVWIQLFYQIALFAQNNRSDYQKYLHLSEQKKKTSSDSALFYAKKALILAENKFQSAFVNEMIAQILYEQGLYSVSVSYFLKSLKIYEANQDQKRVNAIHEKLGFVYVDARQIALAEKQAKYLAQIYPNSQDLKLKISYLLLEGYIAERKSDMQKSLSFYNDVYQQFYQQANDSIKVIILTSLGSIYEDMKEFEKARYFFQESFKLNEKRQDIFRMVDDLNNLGDVYRKNGEYKKGLPFTLHSLKLAQQHKLSWFINGAYKDIYQTYEIANQLDSALHYSKLYHKTTLEMFDETSRKQLSQMEILYESEQMNKEIAIQKAQIDTQQQRFIFLIFLSVILVGLALFIYFHLRRQKATSKLLATQNAEIQSQKDEILMQNAELQKKQEEILAQRDYIESKNIELEFRDKQISSSIKAAKAIQQAVLPYKVKMDELLKEYFVIYKPKDVVSGDFYWLNQIEGKTILIVADCTGHGVPGAFMTMIGNTLLDKIIRLRKIVSPSEILNQLHQEIYAVLRQEESKDNHGMDLGIISIERVSDTDVRLVFCGAKTDLYYLSAEQTEVSELKGTRKSVGGLQNDKTTFCNQEIYLSRGSSIYIGTDGLADQCNMQRKKLGSKHLKKILSEISTYPFAEQKILIEQVLDEYSKNTLQRDDILWLGFKIH